MLRSKHISPVKAMLKRSFFKQGFPPNNVDPTLLNFRRSNKSNGHSSAGLHILRHCKKVGNISLNSGPQARFQSEQEGKPTHNRKEIESMPHWLNVGKASLVSCWAFQLAVQIGSLTYGPSVSGSICFRWQQSRSPSCEILLFRQRCLNIQTNLYLCLVERAWLHKR